MTSVRLPPDEPDAGPWQAVRIPELVASLVADTSPAVIAIDGRSSSGKTTVANRMGVLTGAAVVHTDDLAWHHSVFAWDDLLVNGVLHPVRAGVRVLYRPPAWEARQRGGAIEVAAGVELLVVEGVGSSRASLVPHLDAAIWVQSDADEIEHRNRVRVAAGEISPASFMSWMSEEEAWMASDRPWERAGAIVAGTPELPHDPRHEVVVAR